MVSVNIEAVQEEVIVEVVGHTSSATVVVMVAVVVAVVVVGSSSNSGSGSSSRTRSIFGGITVVPESGEVREVREVRGDR